MGNSIVMIRAVITIAPHFINFKTPRVFSETGRDDAFKALKNILKEIDWAKIDFSKVKWGKIDKIIQRKTFIRKLKKKIKVLPKSEKGKEKEKENPFKAAKNKKLKKSSRKKQTIRVMHQNAACQVIEEIILAIEKYNQKKPPQLRIDQFVWARLCKDLLYKNDIINTGSLSEKIAYRIFVKQFCNVYKEFHQTQIQITPIENSGSGFEDLYIIFLNFLGELERNHKVNEVATIHNFIYLGYCASEESNGFTSENIAMLLTPSLLFGLDRKNAMKADLRKMVYIQFAFFLEELFKYSLFSKPYSKNNYLKFHQERELFKKECKEFWNNDLPDSFINNFMVCLPETLERDEKLEGEESLEGKQTLGKKVIYFIQRCNPLAESTANLFGIPRNRPLPSSPQSHLVDSRLSDEIPPSEIQQAIAESTSGLSSLSEAPESIESHENSKIKIKHEPTGTIGRLNTVMQQLNALKIEDFSEHEKELNVDDELPALILGLHLREAIDTPPPSSNREQISSNIYTCRRSESKLPEKKQSSEYSSRTSSGRKLGNNVQNSPFIKQDTSGIENQYKKF